MSGCTHLCNQGRDCTCASPADGCAARVVRVKAKTTQSEVGNIRFDELDPITPFSSRTMLLFWSLVLAVGAYSLFLIATGLGYLWGYFSAPLQDLFWSFVTQWS